MIVDVHTHFAPWEFVELLASGHGPQGVEVVLREGADPLVVHDNGLRYPIFPGFYDPQAKLEQLDGDGTDVGLVSITPSLFLYWSDPAETARVHRVINDAGARMAQAGGDRLHVMATVPMNDPEEAARELRRSIGELGLTGVEIGTSVGDVMLDHPSLEPFWAAAEELGVPVMLHPYVSMIAEPGASTQGYHLSNVIGNPLETFVAASRLIVGGVLDRHPGLRILLVHGGGAFPYQLGRLQHAYGSRTETRETAKREPGSYLENFLFDTVIFEERSLAFLVERVGAERVLYGTDLPFDMGDTAGRENVSRLGNDVARRILGENALAAYGLAGVSA